MAKRNKTMKARNAKKHAKTHKRKMHKKRANRRTRKSQKGGSVIATLIDVVKTAVPPVLLFEALRAQTKRSKKGGSSCNKKKMTHRRR